MIWTFHPVPDRYLDELAECFPSVQNHHEQTIWLLEPYDQGLSGCLQIWLSGPRIGAAKDEPLLTVWSVIYRLLWKGPVQNQLIYHALLLHQTGYVLRRLQKGAVHSASDGELAVWLFLTWKLYPDPAVTQYILSQRGLPHQRLEVRNYKQHQTLRLSCWLGFLAVFSTSHAVRPPSTWYNGLLESQHLEEQDRVSISSAQSGWVEMLCRTLEHLLEHGVDSDTVFLLTETNVDLARAKAEWDEPDEWALEEGLISYMELGTMLEMIRPSPPNLQRLKHLLGISTMRRLRAAAGSAYGQLSRYLGVKMDKLSAREKYKLADEEQWRSGRLTVYGIASKDEVLMGPMTIIMY